MSRDALRRRLRPHLELLYGSDSENVLNRLLAIAERYRPRMPPPPEKSLWDERDAALIAYPDAVSRPGGAPLRTLHRFLLDQGLHQIFSTLHVLPFMPSSSDGGFSVIDYTRVDEELGSWEDIRRLGTTFRLMIDLVLNHVSRKSAWFRAYEKGLEPYRRFFIEVDPQTDLSGVVRPRSTPLLTPVETSRGRRYLWTTFSADQLDLNYKAPEVLLAILGVALELIGRGARILRLDAVAYLWKEPGTPSIHLPQTHAIVKLLRAVVDDLAPGTLLLTETNVPQEDNFRYFGRGDEAHLVYQFSLPPLLLEAFLSGDGEVFLDWLESLGPTPPATTTINFTASHDGIGLMPLEGLLPAERVSRLIEAVRARGGTVSTRNTESGNRPYELNVSYFDALGDATIDPALHVRRFLAAQSVMIALRGIPAIYFPNLFGTPNDTARMRASGQPRDINRHRFRWEELRTGLGDEGGRARIVLDGHEKLLSVRRAHSAFHPDAAQEVVRTSEPGILSFLRGEPGRDRVLVVTNLGRETRRLSLPKFPGERFVRDLLDEARPLDGELDIGLAPFDVAWCALEPG